MPNPRISEVHAYGFIKDHLKNLGWIVRNPLRVQGGQLFTQNECLEDGELRKWLVQDRPENIVKLTESKYYVIEAKSSKNKLGQAIAEAKAYAKQINQSRAVKAPIVSGIAGNDDEGYVVESAFLVGNEFVPIKINGKIASGLLSPVICKELLERNSAEIADLPIDETIFLKTAEEINKILHLGAINKNQRARVMAALLLALVDDSRPNVDAAPIVLIQDINSRAQNILVRNRKPEFFDCIKIALPPSPDNHIKFKSALVKTIQELENLNIRSAMNSGNDVLGKFYEVFLKYGNGAKEIGIVLTPRHITRFAAEILDINTDDIIYDPTCGTGGFLVAAFDHAKRGASEEDLEYFKKNGLYGIEQEPEVAALAIVNMIFRGDGKNNIIEGNCFSKSLIAKPNGRMSAKFFSNNELPRVKSPAATKVLMNPPFALKKSDEKEFAFVNHALEQMQDEGLLFSVLPSSQLVRQGAYLRWRKELLQNNTLLAVVTFPQDLFYPVGVYTSGIFIRKGIPHPKKQSVLYVRALNDGFVKQKGKRLKSTKVKDEIQIALPIIKKFIADPDMKINAIPEFIKAAKIEFDDESFELVPEAYLDEKPPSLDELKKNIDKVIRDEVAFLIKARKEDYV